MYDPLASPSTSASFGNVDPLPPWPTTPHTPNSPIPNLRPAPTPDRISDANPFEKQAQIYGQPEPGLISPSINPASNGNSFEKPDPYLKVRITGLDRNRRDILVRFDAQVRRAQSSTLSSRLTSCWNINNADESVKLYRNSVPKRVTIICGVSATLRCHYAQQPTDNHSCSPTGTNIRTDRRRR
jgi:hypothetical protein